MDDILNDSSVSAGTMCNGCQRSALRIGTLSLVRPSKSVLMKSANPSEVLLVLGMHRSGTSALSRVFNLLGFAAPKTLIGSNSSNQTGHWESQRVARLNDEILESAELVWSDWDAGQVASIRSRAREQFQTDIINTVREEFPAGRPIVLKDPRICRLFDLYSAAFAAHKIPMRVLIPVRNPLAVIESLKARNHMTETQAGLLWLRHVLDAVEASTGSPRSFVRYETLLDAPIETIGSIVETLEISPPYALDAVKDEILEFLNQDLQHHEFSTSAVASTTSTSGWISDAYEALLVLSRDPNAETALKRLAEIRSQLDQANDMLKTVSEGLSETIARKDTELDAFRDQARASEEQLAESLTEANDWKHRFETVQNAHNALDERLEQARENLLAQSHGIEQLESKLRTSNQEFRTAKTKLEKLTPELRSKEQQLAAQSQKLQAKEKELRQLQRQFYRLKDELSWSKEIIQGYEGSTSWKITAPIRAATRLARDLRSGARPSPAPASVAESKKKNADQSVLDTAEARPDAGPGADPAAQPENLIRDIGLLERSSAFDKAYYLAQYPEASSHPHGPEGHYLSEGWRRGYRPNPTFETAAYVAAHPELSESNTCPLVHYIQTHEGKTDRAERPLNGDARAANTTTGRIAVFTAISGGYDDLKEPEMVSENVDYFVFTDGDVPAHSVWTARPFEFVSHDPTRTARFIKTHPHLYFQDYDWAIWIDANLQLAAPVEQLLPLESESEDFFTWTHPLRDCVYVEAEECIARGKDDNGTIKDQVADLKQKGYPERAGLFETSVLVTRMRVGKVEDMYNAWWAEIAKWSKRDQLSLPFATRSAGIEVGKLARDKICMRTDPRFIYYRHASR